MTDHELTPSSSIFKHHFLCIAGQEMVDTVGSTRLCELMSDDGLRVWMEYGNSLTMMPWNVLYIIRTYGNVMTDEQKKIAALTAHALYHIDPAAVACRDDLRSLVRRICTTFDIDYDE